MDNMEHVKPHIDGHESARVPAGHLAIHVEGAHPVEVHFQFEEQQKRLPPAFLGALAYHVGLLALMFLAIRYQHPTTVVMPLVPDRTDARIVWLNEPGPGGGGGGGGNRMKEPPRPAELPGKDKLTVPVSKPPKLEPVKPTKEPDPVEQLNIPAKSLAAATESLPGAIEVPSAPPSNSQGPGSGGGAGTGTGSGVGPGTGSGLGPGSGGGTGGGAYHPGSGVTMPHLLKEVKPQYTSDAMRAKVQGVVLVECVVNTEGGVEQVKVIRSLDQTFGLDEQAMRAARQWRFSPGLRFGQPVPVIITIELSFTLR
jgi:protein TonB